MIEAAARLEARVFATQRMHDDLLLFNKRDIGETLAEMRRLDHENMLLRGYLQRLGVNIEAELRCGPYA